MFDDVCTDQGGSKRKTWGGVGKKLYKRIGWDIDLVAVLLNGPGTFTESELKTAWKLTEPEKFRLNLDWKFTEFIIQSIFSSDSVNVAGPLNKTATKSLSQPILLNKLRDFDPIPQKSKFSQWKKYH